MAQSDSVAAALLTTRLRTRIEKLRARQQAVATVIEYVQGALTEVANAPSIQTVKKIATLRRQAEQARALKETAVAKLLEDAIAYLESLVPQSESSPAMKPDFTINSTDARRLYRIMAGTLVELSQAQREGLHDAVLKLWHVKWGTPMTDYRGPSNYVLRVAERLKITDIDQWNRLIDALHALHVFGSDATALVIVSQFKARTAEEAQS